MARTVIVKSNVIEEMNKQVRNIKTRSTTGVTKALLFIKRESIKRTPVDTGNLRGSCYTNTYLTLRGVVGEIGYTVFYAPYVHETDKRYRKKGTSWKFLQKALTENKDKIIKIIKDEAYIK